MNKYFEDLEKYINKLEGYKLPSYEELPSISLYMEQVISYVGESIEPITKDTYSVLTPFMVNNYVKAKILESPKNKKYNKEHIGYLLAISLLKPVTSMTNIATIIELDKKFIKDKSKLYTYFKDLEDEVIQNEAHRTKVRFDALNKSSKKKGKSNDASDEELLNLTYIALRSYVESAISKLIADSIMQNISNVVLPAKAQVNAKEEMRIEKRKAETEASKLKNR